VNRPYQKPENGSEKSLPYKLNAAPHSSEESLPYNGCFTE